MVFFSCHLPFVHVLPSPATFPAWSPGLNLKASLKRLHSSLLRTISVSTAPILCYPCPSIPGDPGLCSPCTQPTSPSSFFLLGLRCLPLQPASPPLVLMSPSLLPYHSTAPASPWLLNRPVSPSCFCPFLQPVILSSHLHNGLCSLPAVAEGPPVPHPQLIPVPHLCFQSCLLSPLAGTAQVAAERLFEPLSCTPGLLVLPALICQGC